ncbi:hypothetical protein BDR04DRAFT_1108913 [Suillus decipiens]|nr:hypothetical protein BDR04DRAFT_1108913 [Suillus decipiens]
MTYCKCRHNKEHEFLLFEFGHPTNSQTTILVIDRTPDLLRNNTNGPSSPRLLRG